MATGVVDVLRRLLLLVLLVVLVPGEASAATAEQAKPFEFDHSASVGTGLLSVLGSFSSTSQAAAAPLQFSRFDPALGRLMSVDVTVTTSTATFTLRNTGLLSLISAGSAVQTLGWTVRADATSGGGSNTVTTSGPALLTLLGLGSAEVGGAPLASTATFTSSADLSAFTGPGLVSLAVNSSDTLSAATLVSLVNGAGFAGSGRYAGTARVVYTYAPDTVVTGRVFDDDGAGGGIANNGRIDGREAGVAGSTLRLLGPGDAVLDTQVSGSDGSFRLHTSAPLQAGTVLRVRQIDRPGWLSTGASVGASGGSHDRSTGTTTFSATQGTTYGGLDFGDVQEPVLSAGGSSGVVAGSVAFHAHQFIATTAGRVSFGVVDSMATSGWTSTVHLDANASGTIDDAEPPLVAPLPVTSGQVVRLIVRTSVPAGAFPGLRATSTLSATFALDQATPALTARIEVVDVLSSVDPAGAALSLVVSVDEQSVTPGGVLTYTITFTNTGREPIQDLVVRDATPAYTTFRSSAVGPLPGSLALGQVTTPAIGSRGPLSWSFTGPLPPSATGSVSFTAQVDP